MAAPSRGSSTVVVAPERRSEAPESATGYGRSWAQASDLESFDRFVEDFHAGRINPEDFITTCPGADTCQLGITSSRGLALALTETIEKELGDLADDGGIRIKISGCPNSCGQHHLASIGLYGGARKFHGDAAPAYQLLVGGTVGVDTRFAKPIARVPARLVPDAVRTLLYVYRRDRAAGETFDAFATRTGFERLAELVSPWTELPPATDTPEAYVDWGATRKFTPETGAGECAA